MKKCIVMGNGPSLNNIDISKLNDIDTFSVNKAFKSYDDWNFSPTYYCVIDGNSIRTNLDGIINLIKNNDKIKRFFINNSKNEFDFSEVKEDKRLSIITGFGGAVKFNKWYNGIPNKFNDVPFQPNVTAFVIQLAMNLGYDRIGLVGVDARYTERNVEQIGVYKTGPLKGRPKFAFSDNNDPNHYFKNYHDKGHLANSKFDAN